MAQLLSSCFDAIVGVALVLAIPSAAITKNSVVIAVAVTAAVLAVARVAIERRKVRV